MFRRPTYSLLPAAVAAAAAAVAQVVFDSWLRERLVGSLRLSLAQAVLVPRRIYCQLVLKET
jgi:hypothetical protein